MCPPPPAIQTDDGIVHIHGHIAQITCLVEQINSDAGSDQTGWINQYVFLFGIPHTGNAKHKHHGLQRHIQRRGITIDPDKEIQH
jgi:hypothetical protein